MTKAWRTFSGRHGRRGLASAEHLPRRDWLRLAGRQPTGGRQWHGGPHVLVGSHHYGVGSVDQDGHAPLELMILECELQQHSLQHVTTTTLLKILLQLYYYYYYITTSVTSSRERHYNCHLLLLLLHVLRDDGPELAKTLLKCMLKYII